LSRKVIKTKGNTRPSRNKGNWETVRPTNKPKKPGVEKSHGEGAGRGFPGKERDLPKISKKKKNQAQT